MPRDLVPELHDALKLTTYGHFDILLKPDKRSALERLSPHFPGTSSWRGIVEHHYHPEAVPPLHPHSEDTFRLVMADRLASGYSRVSAGGAKTFTVHRLWNPSATEDRRLKDDDDVIALLNYLASDPPAGVF